MIQFLTQPIIHRPAGYDFAAWTLLLRPKKHNRVPRWLGRAVQALFYSELDRIHPEIATYIHDTPRLKPFTVSNIIDASEAGDMLCLSPDHPIKLRISTLHPHMTALVQNGILPALWKYRFTLHDQPMRIIGINKQPCVANFEDLLVSASDASQVTIQFTSPTSFKRTGGIRIAYPHADLVFGSLYQKWCEVTPYALPSHLRQSIDNCIQLTSVDIQTRELRFDRGRKGVVPCFTGTATYAIHEPETGLRRCIHALAQFAQFSGIGAQTTVGLGQARAVAV